LSSLFPELYNRALDGLIQARKKARVTQTELAGRLARPQSFVAKYEGRERRLDVAEYLSIARELGADPYKLLRGAEKDGA
jgi:transcriptional regulator with XRE-family HTH domain